MSLTEQDYKTAHDMAEKLDEIYKKADATEIRMLKEITQSTETEKRES